LRNNVVSMRAGFALASGPVGIHAGHAKPLAGLAETLGAVSNLCDAVGRNTKL
jgi:hypothetical protein